MFSEAERHYLESTRVARLATADADGRPHVVPVCFALVDRETPRIVTPIDEKPKDANTDDLRRIRDVRENASVALVADHYLENWERLGWVQVRGTASILESGDCDHERAVAALRGDYDQYADHDLRARPIIRIDPGSVLSWGDIDS